LMDYGVHSWDIREGIGRAHALSADAADLLVPFMFIIWQYTIRASADLSPFTIGITVSGRNAGSYRVSVSDKGMSYEPGEVDDLPAVIDFDAGGMVLTAFGRINGGNARGDQALAERLLNLFYRISPSGRPQTGPPGPNPGGPGGRSGPIRRPARRRRCRRQPAGPGPRRHSRGPPPGASPPPTTARSSCLRGHGTGGP